VAPEGADGDAVGAGLVDALGAGAGDWAGVSLVPPVLSPHAIAAIETNAAIIQTNFRMTHPMFFANQPI
jgi:hypothetical protein